MKRNAFPALLLLFALLLTLLCGCGGDAEEPTVPSESEEVAAALTDFEGSSNIKFYSDSGCSFSLLNIGTDEAGDYCWNVELKNLGSQTLIFSMDQVYVNDFAIDPYWAAKVEPGMSLSDTVSWYASDFGLYGVGDVSRVDFRLRIYPLGREDAPLTDTELSLYPRGRSAHHEAQRLWLSTDSILAEKESYALAVTQVEKNSSTGILESYSLRLYLENRSEAEARFVLKNIKVNGQSCDKELNSRLCGGKKDYMILSFDLEDLSQMEVSQVLSIELELEMADCDSGRTLLTDSLIFQP